MYGCVCVCVCLFTFSVEYECFLFRVMDHWYRSFWLDSTTTSLTTTLSYKLLLKINKASARSYNTNTLMEWKH